MPRFSYGKWMPSDPNLPSSPLPGAITEHEADWGVPAPAGSPVITPGTVVPADTTLAPLSIRPTSTINPNRPRTLAAGYSPAQRKVSVVFRDGTPYNYYDVGPGTWFNFARALSKGRFIKATLDGHPHGPATTGGDFSEQEQTVLGATQQIYQGRQQRNAMGGKIPSKVNPVYRGKRYRAGGF